MGSLDGAETAESVALYFLHLLRNCITDSEVGIYRDDGLLLVHEANGPKVDRIRKKIIKVFKRQRVHNIHRKQSNRHRFPRRHP